MELSTRLLARSLSKALSKTIDELVKPHGQLGLRQRGLTFDRAVADIHLLNVTSHHHQPVEALELIGEGRPVAS